MIKGWKKLNREQRQHLKDVHCNDTRAFQRTIDIQAEQHRGGKLSSPPCWECYFIARRLGMEPVGGWRPSEDKASAV